MLMTNAKTTLYREVAARIVTLIDRGILKPGERIPSIRQMSDTLGVSLNTVKEAYSQLENSYHIEAVPQSGFYVRKDGHQRGSPAKVDPTELDPLEVSLCRIYGAFQENGKIPPGMELAIAHVDIDLLPAAKLQKYLVDAVRYNCRECLDYGIAPGDTQLREQIAKHYVMNGTGLTGEELIITNGCHEALFLSLLAVCQPGDTVAIETPLYFNFIRMLESLQLKVLEIPCDSAEGMSLEALQFALDNHRIKAVLSIPNFNNPLGSLMPEENKARMVEMAARHEIPLIEDDIHSDIYFTSKRPLPYRAFDRSGNTILCSSFSKTLAPGLRVGWVAAGRYQARVESLKTLLNIGTSPFTQRCLINFLREGSYERFLRRLRRDLKRQTETLRELILASFPAGTNVNSPPGGFVLWVEVPEGIDTLELFARALKEGIAFAPGPLFSMRGRYSNFLRLTAGVVNENVTDAIIRLGRLMKGF
jgi:DNA-binding transcriptional MocR family regulator